MKLFTCCVLLLFVTMVLTAPVRVRRENVLNFLNDALGTSTEKPTPAKTTAYRNPSSKPVKEQDSEETANSLADVSEAKSTESFDTNSFTGSEVSDKSGGESRDTLKDLDSGEIVISEDVEKVKAPSKGKTNVRPMDMNSQLVQDQGSREYSGPQRASREQTDLNSGEAENVSGKQVVRLSGDQVTGSLHRKATPGRVHGLNGMLTPGRSRELLDRDSLEDNNGRPAPVVNRGDTDYDETREFISSEIYPVVPPEHMASSFSVPAKSRAS